MAIYKSDIVDINLESGSIHRSFLKHAIGTADQAADRFGIRAFRDGQPVDLSGASCYGYFRNSHGTNIALTSNGTVSGNVAYVTLPQACYNYEGNFTLAVKLLVSGVTSTVRIIDGVVDNTNTGSAVAPTSAVPTYSEILSQYDAMVAATAVANGAIATTFNAATVYPAGSYVINDGALYRITADHAANVTWANTSKVSTNFGAEVTALKSAIDVMQDQNLAWNDGYYIKSDGTAANNESYSYTDKIEIIPGTKILVRTRIAGSAVICVYKADGTVDAYTSTAEDAIHDYAISLSSTAKKIRISCKTASKGSAFIVLSVVPPLIDLENRMNSAEKTIEDNEQIMVSGTDTTMWEIGGISVGTGSIAAATNRLRYASQEKNKNISKLTAETGYKISLFCYDSGNSFIGYWDGSKLETTTATTNLWQDAIDMDELPSTVAYIRITIKKTSDADVSFADYVGCVYEYYHDPAVSANENSISAIAKTITDDYVAISEIGTGRLKKGAIDSSGADTTTSAYQNNSRRTKGLYAIGDADYIISEVEQNTATNYYNYVAFYDSSLAYLSREGGQKQTRVIAAVPSSAKYYRVSLTQITSSTLGDGNIKNFSCKAAVKNREITMSPSNKWYALGDSISAGYYSMTASMAEAAGLELDYVSPVTTEQGEETGSVYDSSLAHNYWGYANKWKLHRQLVKKASPGQGYFKKTSSGSKNGIDVVTENDFSDAGLITVAWGFNDWHYDMTRGSHDLIDPSVPYPTAEYDTTQITTVNQAIWFCLGELIRTAPKAKIVVQTPMNGWAYGGDFASNWGIGYSMEHSGKLSDIHDDIVYWANYYGLQILEMTYNNSVVNRLNIKTSLIDGSHPSDDAHQQLGRYVAEMLGYC